MFKKNHMSTTADVISGLPQAAQGITTDDTVRFLNDDVRMEIRDELYTTFESSFSAEQIIPVVLPGQLVATIGAVAGNIDVGEYEYRITFDQAYGETRAGTLSSSITIADNAVIGQILLSEIPISDDTSTTARKIYRRQNGKGDFLLLTTISDNTTQTYTDNTAQSGLGINAPMGIPLATDFYEIKALKQRDIDVPVVIRASTSNYPSRLFAWIDYQDHPDGTSSMMLVFPDNFEGSSDLTLSYFQEIPDATDSGVLPYPLALHPKLLPILRLGVAFFHLSELPDENDQLEKVGLRFEAKRAQLFTGSISHTN